MIIPFIEMPNYESGHRLGHLLTHVLLVKFPVFLLAGCITAVLKVVHVSSRIRCIRVLEAVSNSRNIEAVLRDSYAAVQDVVKYESLHRRTFTCSKTFNVSCLELVAHFTD